MNTAEIATLFDYNYWANGRVLNAASRVTPAQFVAPAGLSHGSVRGALVHVLSAEVVWRLRCQEGISPPAMLLETGFPTLDSLREFWNEEERGMRAYLEGLTDDDISGTVRYQTTKRVPHQNELWHLLAHVVNHGTQFRGEAAVVLTACGQSPGDLDLIFFLRAMQAIPAPPA
ncbi:MAG: DinB family protein [Anaerolineae bacterium]